MKVYDTSGKLHNWTPKSNPRFRPSSYHESALALVRQLYSVDQILEEVYLPGENMYLDIFLPSRKLAVEIQGEQHYKFNNHFYKHEDDFRKAQMRDKRKAEWCNINGIDLVTLDYNNESEWERLIISR